MLIHFMDWHFLLYIETSLKINWWHFLRILKIHKKNNIVAFTYRNRTQL